MNNVVYYGTTSERFKQGQQNHFSSGKPVFAFGGTLNIGNTNSDYGANSSYFKAFSISQRFEMGLNNTSITTIDAMNAGTELGPVNFDINGSTTRIVSDLNNMETNVYQDFINTEFSIDNPISDNGIIDSDGDIHCPIFIPLGPTGYVYTDTNLSEMGKSIVCNTPFILYQRCCFLS